MDEKQPSQAGTQLDRIERLLALLQVDIKQLKAAVEALAKRLGLEIE